MPELSEVLGVTTDEAKQILAGRYHSFLQDIADTEHTSAAPQAITANTPVRYTNNAGTTNGLVAPYYMTDRWDSTNNKMAFISELNTPIYVAEVNFIFAPSIAAKGRVTLRLWVDDATPKLIGTYTSEYKAVAEPHAIITTFYLGSTTGYDLKNDGVYFTLEFETAGDLYDKTIKIYRT